MDDETKAACDRAVRRVRMTILTAIRDRMRELIGQSDVELAHTEADEGLRVALGTVAGQDEVGHLLAEIVAAYDEVRKWYS